MRAEDIVGILKGRIDPRSYDDSCSEYSDCDIRYPKNVGLLDCYYDYGSNREMVFTTGSGMRYIGIHDGNADLDDLRDIVDVRKDLSGNEYIDAVKKAVGARTDRGATWSLGVSEDGPERSNHIVQAAVLRISVLPSHQDETCSHDIGYVFHHGISESIAQHDVHVQG